MSQDMWNPSQYNRFQNERSQPFWDLCRSVDFSKVRRLLDVGCGTGELTSRLRERENVPFAMGVDSSEKMLDEARAFAGEKMVFEKHAAESYAPTERFDAVISNAALQWAPGHRELFPRMLTWLNDGGQLAVQMPYNFDHPSHVLAEQLATEYGLTVRKTPVLPIEDYAGIMVSAGGRDVRVSMNVYLHPMKSGADVVEWTKGTLLTHYQKQLSPEKYAEFLVRYTSELVAALGSGPYLYTFKRMFVFARH
jgi:trans-aconitate 2-methyltransferase